MSKAVRSAVVAGALAFSATSANAVSYNVSNSFAGWVSTLAVFGTGTFQNPNNPGVAGPNVVLNGLPGVSFTQVGSGSASFDGGLLNNLAASTGSGSNYLEWTFTKPQNGWGGTFQMSTGNGLYFKANDQDLGWVDVTDVGSNQALSGFFGFTTAAGDEFLGVRVFGGPNGSSYRMTDVSVGAVPEPSTWALMIAGLAGLGFAARRRKAQ